MSLLRDARVNSGTETRGEQIQNRSLILVWAKGPTAGRQEEEHAKRVLGPMHEMNEFSGCARV